ncbi:hypothetical protein G6F33_007153 [Rhizopus arrhizus]|uniref:Tc1-like transposase DDE domain-containing protein n=1 Tax=Rhizopus oryzae TaxID=64495 RepID=A0A9P7BUK9_RHIOR|nr:hypothetical protein G6F23_009015 [Rhizopus arrhizus]KAG0911257.1 hypothetical protein G6F33_007153 [Rhizopus arrhizus]KAG1311414.1 hypothetical protein G6F64_003821 [Rhizopus arrhizus]KAG1375612.1 hypothetical protein G6F61_008318 [Rhizopus arrhizus]
MDNAPIHTHSDIDELITLRGYRSIYLLTYSPELNPIEQFWSVVKNKVKRGTFSDDEDLKTRIADACNNVPIQHVKAFIQHSLIPAIRNRIMTTQRTDNEYFTKKHYIVHQQFPTNSEVMIKNVNRNSKLTEGTLLSRDVPTSHIKLISTDNVVNNHADQQQYHVQAII